MVSKWLWLLSQLTGRLWVRSALFALLGVLSALAAILFKHLVPFDLPGKIGADAVDSILNILAASMLAVTTFSLSVMVTALGAATSHVSPRATQLLVHDSTTQNVLATFLGSFLFSLVGIIALSTGAYGGTGRVILFAVTLLVIAIIVITMVRWIDYLTDFGLVSETTSRVERAAAKALAERGRYPAMGGAPMTPTTMIPADAFPVMPEAVGYVQHVDIGRLSDAADHFDLDIFVSAPPGTFVHPGSALLWTTKAPDADLAERLRSAWTIRPERTFQQDPRFGIIVLAEIASRALSPGINDPGTAIDISGRLVRLLLEYCAQRPAEDVLKFPRVHVPLLSISELIDDGFDPIARYGAGDLAVSIRLQNAFSALAASGHPAMAESAKRHSVRAIELAQRAGVLATDLDVLRKAGER